MTVERIDRWNGGLAGALVLSALGIALLNPVLIVSAAIPLTYVIVGALSDLPDIDGVTITRSVSDRTPAPGDEVTVTLTVTNDGEETLADLRVIDGVPEALAVVSGSARSGLTLRPGGETSVEYTVVAKRGDHTFGEPVIRIRSLAATLRRTVRVPVAGDESLACLTELEEVPLSSDATRQVGGLATDSPGIGLEFYAMREYRPGDHPRRIDWRRYAKTGSLTTVQYREQRAARIMVVVDARGPARVATAPGHPTASELCTYGADRAISALLEAGHYAGMTVLGVETDQLDLPALTLAEGLPWVECSDSPETTERARHLLDAVGAVTATIDGKAKDVGSVRRVRRGPPPHDHDPDRDPNSNPDFDPVRADGRGGRADTREVIQRLQPETQVIFFTPLLDAFPAEFVTRLRVEGHETTVVTPDVTRGDSLGKTQARLERSLRIHELRREGTTLIDWDPDQPLRTALSSALERFLHR